MCARWRDVEPRWRTRRHPVAAKDFEGRDERRVGRHVEAHADALRQRVPLLHAESEVGFLAVAVEQRHPRVKPRQRQLVFGGLLAQLARGAGAHDAEERTRRRPKEVIDQMDADQSGPTGDQHALRLARVVVRRAGGWAVLDQQRVLCRVDCRDQLEEKRDDQTPLLCERRWEPVLHVVQPRERAARPVHRRVCHLFHFPHHARAGHHSMLYM